MIKVLGCGNLLSSDEGIGIHAIREIKEVAPQDVIILELRRPGLFLANLICESPTNKLIIIDALEAGSPIGKIEKFEFVDPQSAIGALKKTIHGFNLLPYFENAVHRNQIPGKTVLFAIAISERDKFHVGLSVQVRKALPQLVKVVLEEIQAED